MMLGVAPPSTACSWRELPLHPASVNKALMLAGSYWSSAGTSLILSRTVVFPAASNWTFCAGQAPHTAMMEMTRAARMIKLILYGFANNFSALERGIHPWNFRIVGENGEPLLRNGSCIVFLAVLNDLQWEKVISHHPGHVEMPGGGNQV